MQAIHRLHKTGHLTDQQAIACARFAKDPAVANLSPTLHRVLHDILVEGVHLEVLEKRRGWSARSAKVVLGVILDALVERGGADPVPEPTEEEITAREKLAYMTDDLDQEMVALGRQYGLTAKEAAVFVALRRAGGRTLSKENLLRACHPLPMDDELPDLKIVDVYVCKIRQKLKGARVQILTDWGLGYRLEDRRGHGVILDSLSRDLPVFVLHHVVGIPLAGVAERCGLSGIGAALAALGRVQAAIAANPGLEESVDQEVARHLGQVETTPQHEFEE